MRKIKPLRTIPLVFCTAVLMALAACGGGAASSGSSSGSGPAPTGTPIKIGIPGEFTGPNSSSLQGMKDVADAWVESVNDHGGIAGHPVQVVYGDSGGQPAKGSQAVRDLIETQGVVVLAGGHDTSAETAYAPYVQSKGVPNVGGSTYGDVWTHTPMYFPLGLAGDTVDTILVKVAAQTGTKVMGSVVCAEVAQCAETPKRIAPAMAAAGITMTEPIPVAASAPSHTAECLSLKQSGTQLVFLALNATVGAKLVKDCAQQGVRPTFLYVGSSYSADLTQISGLKAIGLPNAFPWFVDDPKVQPFKQMMQTYSSVDKVKNPSNTATYAALEYVKKAIESQKPAADAPVTSKTVLDGIYSLKDEDLGGLLAEKFTFTPNDTARHPKCTFEAQVENGKLTSSTGLTPICGTGVAS